MYLQVEPVFEIVGRVLTENCFQDFFCFPGLKNKMGENLMVKFLVIFE